MWTFRFIAWLAVWTIVGGLTGWWGAIYWDQAGGFVPLVFMALMVCVVSTTHFVDSSGWFDSRE